MTARDTSGPATLRRRRQEFPRVSVFTPSHQPRFLDQCLRTLQAQTFQDWEWVVVLNQGARWRPATDDPRVHVVVDDGLKGVGAAKQKACAIARGEILVELDHDDELRSDALELVVRGFDEHPEAGLVFSSFAQIKQDGSRDESRFDERYGWVYREAKVDGRAVLQCDALEASPHNVSYIWYAPNHVRAFRQELYDRVGGYDPAREVLDDQDLMCRMYQLADFHLLGECLYLQRVHEDNTQRDSVINQRIQAETVALYDAYIEPNAVAWARRSGLEVLDLGSMRPKPEGYTRVGPLPAEDVDVVADVDKGLDLPDSSVGVVRAIDHLQHVPDKVGLFNELYRIMAHGGVLFTLTPSTDGRGAFQDPSHVAYYNENSFWYYTDRQYSALVPALHCRFQVSRLVTFFPTPWHEQNSIPYVCANLIAIKDGPRQGGFLLV